MSEKNQSMSKVVYLLLLHNNYYKYNENIKYASAEKNVGAIDISIILLLNIE